jgi:hypothetical protein
MNWIAGGVVRAFITGCLITVASAAASFAQDGDVALGSRLWKGKAPCRACHGWGAHGTQDDPQSPVGANLRATTLTPDQMAEVILCGRPESSMPFFHRNAWTADFPCYGMTRADVGDLMPEQARPSLTEREANALVAYVFMDFVGKPQPTFEECKAFWGADATRCAEYPHAAAP